LRKKGFILDVFINHEDVGAGAGSADGISEGAEGGRVARYAGDVVDLISSLAEWTIEDPIGVY
jgi:hypothetical protein